MLYLYIYALLFLIGGNSVNGWSSSDLNELIDNVLDLVRPMIVEQKLNEVDLGGLDYDFSYKIWLLNIRGSFSCRGGKLRSLASVYRTGDASTDLVDKDTSLEIEAPLGLRVLDFQYDQCTLDVTDVLRFSSPVSGSVGKSSLDLEVVATPEGDSCKAVVRKIDLKDLSGISVSTGSDIFAKLRDEVINKVLTLLRGYIFSSVNDGLKQFQGQEFHFTKSTLFPDDKPQLS